MGRGRRRYQVRVCHARGLREWVVAQTGSLARARAWRENLRAALRESLASDALSARVVRLRPLTEEARMLRYWRRLEQKQCLKGVLV